MAGFGLRVLFTKFNETQTILFALWVFLKYHVQNISIKQRVRTNIYCTRAIGLNLMKDPCIKHNASPSCPENSNPHSPLWGPRSRLYFPPSLSVTGFSPILPMLKFPVSLSTSKSFFSRNYGFNYLQTTGIRVNCGTSAVLSQGVNFIPT